MSSRASRPSRNPATVPPRRGRPASVAAALGVVALSLTGAPVASAQSDTTASPLGGSPMNVFVGPRGQLQGFYAGQEKGIYYSPTKQVGDAGFFLAFPEAGNGPSGVSGSVFGFAGSAFGDDDGDDISPYTPRSQSPTTGTGTAADPFRQITRYDVDAYGDATEDTAAEVTQTTTYVNGEGLYRVRWDVRNTSGGPLNLRAIVAADFYFDGDDTGTGVFTAGPPRFVGGTNVDTGRSGGFEEAQGPGTTPWTRYQALPYGGTDEPGSVWNTVRHAADDGEDGFDDTVVGGQVDNAGAAQWDDWAGGGGLPAGATATYQVVARAAIPAALQLTPPNAQTQQGTPLGYTAAITDTDGRPIFVGRTLRYTIAGANAGGGTLPIGADGHATIVNPAANLGQDTTVVYLDLNDDGVRDASEPQASVVSSVVDTIPPVCSSRVPSSVVGGRGKKAKAFQVVVTCDSPATLDGTVRLSVRTKKHVTVRRHGKKVRRTKVVKVNVALGGRRTSVAPGVPATLSFPVPASAAKRYGKLSALGLATLAATDASGNRSAFKASRAVKLADGKKVVKKHAKKPSKKRRKG
ncbi:hypothetical protein AB0L40_03950 [Patulibacter sp. NPDC049589]|uniref:hypothetical protein n=1 Tax=Patulibacter sp. NPDC049589 TaxID=3154731 RepID=UPI00341FC913